MEIGSFQGKSTVFIATALKEEKCNKVYAVDPHLGEINSGKKEFSRTYNDFLGNIKAFGVDKYVVPIRKTSEEAGKKWRNPISMLFVDGLHDYIHVKQDLSIWLPFLSDGGILICHDAFAPHPDVFRALKQKVFTSKNFRYISFANSIIYAVKGRPAGVKEKAFYEYNKFMIILTAEIWHFKYLSEAAKQPAVNILKKFILKEKS